MSMFGGFGNIAKMMGQLKDIQGNLRAMQERAEGLVEEASSGGGMVTASVNGKGRVVSLKIDPTAIDPTDGEMLEDLVLSAVNAAQARMQERMKAEMQEAMGGIDMEGMEHLKNLLG